MSSSKIIKSNSLPSKEPTLPSFYSDQKKENLEKAGFRRDFWIKGSYTETKKGYLEADKEQAREIVEQARTKAEIIEKEAYEKAFALGEKAGMEVAKRKFQPALDSLDQAKKEFDRLVREVLVRSEAEIIKLCLAVCRKIISLEITQNRDMVVNAIKIGLQSLLDATSAKIRINPANLEHVQQSLDEIIATKDGLKDVVFEGDERIGKGDAVIETSFGNVDYRVEKKMEEIENQFLKTLDEKKKVP